MAEHEKSGEELRTKLQSMWTAEVFDRFEADLRVLLQTSPKYKDKPAEREGTIAELKKKAIELAGSQTH